MDTDDMTTLTATPPPSAAKPVRGLDSDDEPEDRLKTVKFYVEYGDNRPRDYITTRRVDPDLLLRMQFFINRPHLDDIEVMAYKYKNGKTRVEFVTPESFDLIIKYLTRFPAPSKINMPITSPDLTDSNVSGPEAKWINELYEEKRDDMMCMWLVANYLGVQSLVDLVTAQIAAAMKNKSIRQIASDWGYTGAVNDAILKEVRDEYGDLIDPDFEAV